MWAVLPWVVVATAAARRPKWFELSRAYSYEEYLADMGKEYSASSAVGASRRHIFESRLAAILTHNADPSKTYKKGVNWLTDLDKAPKGGLVSSGVAEVAAVGNGSLPEALDWRESSVVTEVKNQGSCGSCWAFAATETIESRLAQATGTLLVLAPQVWVDCAENPNDCGGSGGCAGATAEIAYSTAMKYGAYNESQVPYAGEDETCALSALSPVANITGFVRIPRNSDSALALAVAQGPIAVSVDASWGDYETGVFQAADGGSTIDHAVQLVGYGFDDDVSMDYWLVRNSWGESWGEDGYIRLQRLKDGSPCVTDTKNQDGVGCDSDPSNVTVCGTSGILYDSSFPTGAYLL